MSLSKYETFLEVAKTLSMSKAAYNTHQTVQGVSYAISKLENEFGVALFIRNHSKISLTSEGHEILPYIKQMIEIQEQLNERLAIIKGEEYGSLSVGGFRVTAAIWLPGIIKLFEQKHPNIKVDIHLNEFQNVKNDLINGEIDLAFAAPPESKSLDFIPLIRDRFVIVVHKSHPLSQRSTVTADDLHGERLNTPIWSYDKEFADFLNDSRIKESIHFEIMDERTLLSMAEHQMGVTILTDLLVWNKSADLVTVPIEGIKAREFGVLLPGHKKSSFAVKKFIECTRQWLEANHSESYIAPS